MIIDPSNLAIIMSAIAIILTIYNTIMAQKRIHRVDTQTDTSTITTLIVRMENIDKGVHEIKTEMNVIRRDLQHLRDKVIVDEHTLKTIGNRIEKIEQNTINQ